MQHASTRARPGSTGAEPQDRAVEAMAPLKRPLLWGGLGFAGLAVVAGLGVAHGQQAAAQAAFDRMLASGSSMVTDVTAIVLDTMLSTAVAAVLLLIAAVAVSLWANAATAGVFVVGVAATWAVSLGLSIAVNRPLAGVAVSHAPAPFGYPSAPTALAAAVVVAVAFLARARGWRSVAIALGVVAVAVSAWSRLYLGVADVSDVVAGVIVGAAVQSLYYPLVLNVLLGRGRRRALRQ